MTIFPFILMQSLHTQQTFVVYTRPGLGARVSVQGGAGRRLHAAHPAASPLWAAPAEEAPRSPLTPTSHPAPTQAPVGSSGGAPGHRLARGRREPRAQGDTPPVLAGPSSAGAVAGTGPRSARQSSSSFLSPTDPESSTPILPRQACPASSNLVPTPVYQALDGANTESHAPGVCILVGRLYNQISKYLSSNTSSTPSSRGRPPFTFLHNGGQVAFYPRKKPD